MAEFQWWLLIVGLVAGGGLVAVVLMDSRRREEDVTELERRAEATWISDRLSSRRNRLDPRTVESVLREHREYLGLPPPDELVVRGDPGASRQVEGAGAGAPAQGEGGLDELDRDADEPSDEVRDDRRRRADEDLART
jgi:hypothetical protein